MDDSNTLWTVLTSRLSEASDDTLSPEQITRATSLSDDLDLSSLQMVSLILDLEEDFQIEVDDEEIEKLAGSVGDIFDYVEQRLSLSESP